jgi:hypothetical protein
MKKYSKLIVCFCLLLALFAVGCKAKTEERIELSFDKTEAYFNSKVLLKPIAGDEPSETDIFDEAIVTLYARPQSQIALRVSLDEGEEPIEGLKIWVEGSVFAVDHNAEIYRSADLVEQISLSVKIFLAKDAPTAVANRELRFYFQLSA